MLVILLREITRMLKVSRLAQDADGRRQVERQLLRDGVVIRVDVPPRLGLDEAVQARNVLEFGVSV
jgi:hypothetical protein